MYREWEPQAAKSQEARAASPKPKKFQKGQRAMSQFSGMAGGPVPPRRKKETEWEKVGKWKERGATILKSGESNSGECFGNETLPDCCLCSRALAHDAIS